jgi:ribosomal protein S18 acetylase RimI-like enzyme
MQIRPMRRDELDVLVEWAAAEGWNPGLDDAEVFWATDPDAFVAMEVDGELAGGGSIVSYGGLYGFMGFFIVRADLRHEGLGRQLWYERKRRLLARLAPDAAIEMDGVFAMEHFYAEGGFVAQHRDLRFETVARAAEPAEGVVDVSEVPFEHIDRYDRAHFPAPRPEFLRRWIARPGGHAVALYDETCRGYAVSRPSRVGHRIGPLFADEPADAEALFAALEARLVGETIFLDVPERNAAALALVERHGMHEGFGCARMTLGPPPELPWDQIFGVTTLELG